ncbi:hypothetical protein [Rhizobium sp. FKL33]|jgi:hypothetical protein|uniref:hypothetical protein n=1 Tax=Rhizobium sp. FKL33 TaxID=2562307 RepID=UPI0010C0D5C2|nr:hypothetical protein [Rhizobium sp. FKL33]
MSAIASLPKGTFQALVRSFGSISLFAAAGASAASGYTPQRVIVTSANVYEVPTVDHFLKEPMVDFKPTIEAMKSRGLPVTVIASLMRVERKTVYSWLSDAQPRREAQERLALVYPVLDAAFGGNFKTIHRLWGTKDRLGVTLEALLTTEDVNVAALQRHLETFAPAIRRYAAQDADTWSSGRGGNGFVDDSPVVVSDRI